MAFETFVIYAAVQDEMWDQISLKLLGSERYTNVLIGANPLFNRVVRFEGGEILLIPAVSTRAAVGAFPWSATYALT